MVNLSGLFSRNVKQKTIFQRYLHKTAIKCLEYWSLNRFETKRKLSTGNYIKTGVSMSISIIM